MSERNAAETIKSSLLMLQTHGLLRSSKSHPSVHTESITQALVILTSGSIGGSRSEATVNNGGGEYGVQLMAGKASGYGKCQAPDFRGRNSSPSFSFPVDVASSPRLNRMWPLVRIPWGSSLFGKACISAGWLDGETVYFSCWVFFRLQKRIDGGFWVFFLNC